MYQVHSTEDVLSETVSTLRDRNPAWNGGAISRLRARLVESLDELVDDFDGSIDYFGEDPDDRHVHAGAVAAQAHILLTEDAGLHRMGQAVDLPYSVYNCDDFFCLIDDSTPLLVQRATYDQQVYWNDSKKLGAPPRGLVKMLEDSGCPNFALRVNMHLRTLSGVPKHRK